MSLKILAIESSCDETAAAIIVDGQVLCNKIATQKVHEEYGGVVPELASRAHMQNIVPIVEVAMREAGIDKKDLNAVAFTHSPGLIGSLLVGAGFAKGLAQVFDIPLIAVPHVKAHVMAHFIEDPKPQFPFLCLTVSGGHTQLVLVTDYLTHQIIGTTKDDAAGEAFDKIGKMLGLPYPAGPHIDRLAKEGDASKFNFPIVRLEGYDYSFSGLKTAVLYHLQKQVKEQPTFVQDHLADICAAVQYTIVETLLVKMKRAMKEYKIKHIGIAGGVSANSGLRAAIQELADRQGATAYIPKFEYCTDNAAMIAITAHYQYLAKDFSDMSVIPSARS